MCASLSTTKELCSVRCASLSTTKEVLLGNVCLVIDDEGGSAC
jgi:hypothetical protein